MSEDLSPTFKQHPYPAYPNIVLFPVNSDPKFKNPFQDAWQILTLEDSINFYAKTKSKAWGALMGKNSNYIECIDFDAKTVPLAEKEQIWQEFVEFAKVLGVWEKFVIEQTPSTGYHIFYRCPEAGEFKSQKLSKYWDGDVIFETKGTLGYAKIYPSPGYKKIQGNLDEIFEITAEERDLLLDRARSYTKIQIVETPERTYEKKDIDPNSPAHKFNEEYDPIPLLQEKGWTVVNSYGDELELKRPGKTDQQRSATWNHNDNKRFCVWSTSCLDFEGDGKTYSAFDIVKILKCEGDNYKTFKFIEELGYKSDKKPIEEVVQTYEESVRQPDYFRDFIRDTKITYEEFKNRPPKEESYLLKMHIMPNDSDIPDTDYYFLRRSFITCIASPASAGKTTIVKSILAQFYVDAAENQYLSIVKTPQCKKVLIYDSENPRQELYEHYESIFKLLGKVSDEEQEMIFRNPDVVHISHKDQQIKKEFKRWCAEEKKKGNNVDVIDWIIGIAISEHCDLIILDNVDLIVMDESENANSQKSHIYVDKLTDYLTDNNMGLLATVHTNPRDMKPRGHLGTAIWQKSDITLNLSKNQNHEEFGNLHKFHGGGEYAKSRNGLHDAVQYNNRYGFTYSFAEKRHILVTESSKEEIKEIKKDNREKEKELREEEEYRIVDSIIVNLISQKANALTGEVKQKIMDSTTIGKSKANDMVNDWISRNAIHYNITDGGNKQKLISKKEREKGHIIEVTMDIDRKIKSEMDAHIPSSDSISINKLAEELRSKRICTDIEYAKQRIEGITIQCYGDYTIKDGYIERKSVKPNNPNGEDIQVDVNGKVIDFNTLFTDED